MSAAAKGEKSNLQTEQIKNFDTVRNILRNAKGSKGEDLYSHLVEIIDHIVTHCPDDGLDKLEEISYLLKHKEDINMEDYLNLKGTVHYSKPDHDKRELTMKYL